MLKVRVIPCLDVKDGRVVKGVQFLELRDAGDPVEQAAAYDAAGADELMFLDITASHEGRGAMLDVIARTAEVCFMPVSVGGGIRTVEDARTLLRAGRRQDLDQHRGGGEPRPDQRLRRRLRRRRPRWWRSTPSGATDGAEGWEVFTYGGRKPTGLDAVDYAARAVERGAGRDSVDLDGPRRRAGRLRCRSAGAGERGGGRAGDRQRRRGLDATI